LGLEKLFAAWTKRWLAFASVLAEFETVRGGKFAGQGYSEEHFEN
jgi:hypothetical protein